MFYLTINSTYFIYSYMMPDLWYRTTEAVKAETSCLHIGYYFRLVARLFLMQHPTDRIAPTTAFVTPVK